MFCSLKFTRAHVCIAATLSAAVISSCGSESAVVAETADADAASQNSKDGNGVDAVPDGKKIDTSYSKYDVPPLFDIAADSIPLAGEFGASCKKNEDCGSGLCAATEYGMQCTILCVSDCPKGFACQQNISTSGDPAFYCFSKFLTLCNPCHQHSDCAGGGSGSVGNKCLDRSGDGKFCGTVCETVNDCPNGYDCKEFSVDGASAFQCAPQKNALCSCNQRAKDLQISTTCYNPASPSSCKGTRACGPNGLGTCIIQSKPEVCNGLDDDCDNETDEGLCDDGNKCTSDKCNTDGSCKYEQLQGTECDDGNKCTTVDKCASGKCIGGALKLCDDGNACTDDKCDPAGGCLFTSNKDNCEDGNPCTLKDKCSEKNCIGGPPPSCNDNNPCTTDSCNPIIGCVHKADTKNDGIPCTDDLNKCTTDQCLNGQCSHIQIPGCK